MNFCLHYSPYMTEINTEKMAPKAKSHILRPFSSTIFFFSHRFRPYVDHSGDMFAWNNSKNS